jgi:prevent-host-death family protein
MLNIYKDIHSLTDFKRRTSELLEHLQRTNRPIVLTVNGRPAVVLQDAEAYQRFLTGWRNWKPSDAAQVWPKCRVVSVEQVRA